MSKCLPCAVHNRKSIKEILIPLIVERDHSIALAEGLPDDQYDKMIDEAWEEFWKECCKYKIDSFNREDRGKDLIFEDGAFDIMMADYEYAIYFMSIE